jgi:hypothetical protein
VASASPTQVDADDRVAQIAETRRHHARADADLERRAWVQVGRDRAGQQPPALEPAAGGVVAVRDAVEGNRAGGHRRPTLRAGCDARGWGTTLVASVFVAFTSPSPDGEIA